MANKYSISGPNQSAAAPQTIAQIVAASTVRPRLYDILVGSAATPADQAMIFALGRTTTAPTGTSITPIPLDATDVASLCSSSVITVTSESTYTSPFLLQIGLNQRATFRWVAAPDGELYGTASANNGLGAKVHTSTATLVMYSTLHWAE